MRIFKKMLSAVMVAVLCVSLFSGTVVFAAEPSLENGYNVKAATDSAYSTVLGKSITKTYGGYASNVYTYGASGFTANFIGTEFWMYVPDLPKEDLDNDTQMETCSQDVMVLVDTDMPMEATKYTVSKPGWICIASGLEKNVPHTVTMYKMSRGFYGFMASEWIPVSHIATDGTYITPDPVSDLVIEVYGDSISNGDAIWLNENGTNSAYTYGSYSSIVGRLLGGEIRVCGNTGNGLLGWVMANPGNGQIENLFPPQANWDKFDTSCDSSINWSHSGDNAADVVIINLGTNDRVEFNGGDMTSQDFYNEYIKFVKKIKTDCPKAIVICALGAMGGITEFGSTIKSVVKDANTWADEEFAFWTELQACNTIPGGLGYDNRHPSNVAQEIYGLQIAEIINEKLGLGVDLKKKTEEIDPNPNLNLDQIYSASSVYNDSLGISKAFDGDYSTSWQAAENSVAGSWLQVKYDEEKTVSKVVIEFEQFYPTGNTKIEYSLDGQNWSVFKTFTVDNIGTYTFTADTAVSAKYLRITFSGSSQGGKYGAKVKEFEAYEFKTDVSYTVAQRSTAESGNNRVRLMAAVSNCDCSRIGFEITAKDNIHSEINTTTWEDNVVYSSIAGVTAETLGLDEGYVFAITITEVPENTVLSVRAYTVDDEGNKIYGNGGKNTEIVMVNGILTVVN